MNKLLILPLLFLAFTLSAQDNGYQRPPDDIAKLVEAPLTPAVTFSPDKSLMALMDRSDLPSIEELSRPELRIGGLRINPDNYGPSRTNFFIGIRFKNLKDQKTYTVTGLPSPLQVSSFAFSPDSRKASFVQTYPDRLELWVIDLTTFQAKALSKRKVNATLANPAQWLSNSNQILMLAAATEGKVMAARSRVPGGPVVEENLGKKAPSRTYQDLLKNEYDESLFDFYCTSQLVLVGLDGTEKNLGTPAVYNLVNASPDASLILTRAVHRPYSYLVPANLFPQTVQVSSLDGSMTKKIAEIPLGDNIPIGFSAVIAGPRGHGWRSDLPSTLYWVEAQDKGDPKATAEIRDKVYTWSAPFNGNPSELIDLPLRYAGIVWGNDKLAWVYETWWSNRKTRTTQIDPSTLKKKVIVERSYEDTYSDPGDVYTQPNAYGRQVMAITPDHSVYLIGQGASEAGDRPFLDKMDVQTGKVTRLWRSEAPYYEWVVGLTDLRKATFITSRESTTEPANYYLRTAGSTQLSALTSFPHPYPQIRDVHKQVLKYKRADGVDLTADLYLPPGYKKEDGPLPAFFWAYPEEFKSRASAGQVKGSPYTFTRIGWGSPIYWVVRGYAVLDNVSIPIVGEGDKEPNDTYVDQLVSSAKAAIDYAASLGVVDPNRVGVGGHSYGAFMTANLLAHSNLFKAGISRSGAYNRTLTPFGFQAEERTYWQAPEIYYQMSPFSYADKIKTPILLIHGEADNNPGTFPIQTERFYNAIKGHGGTARYVVLPYESHGYRAKESIMHMLWEMDNMLETYVKGNPQMKGKIESR